MRGVGTMTARVQAPPPVLECARVLAYGLVDPSIDYVERKTLYIGKDLVGCVPRLAICQNLGEDEVLVFHCNNDWGVVGVAGGHSSVEEAKRQVERSYPGMADRWVDTNVSEAEATAYLRKTFPDDECSFCGRTLHEVQRFFVGPKGRICDICVREFSSNISGGE